MKKMFYAVAVVAAMAVCSCGNKAQTTETEIVEDEAVEIVTPDSACCQQKSSCCQNSDSCATDSCTKAVPCDSCKKGA